MKTDAIPDLPTREQELNYMKYLERSIASDPWFSIRGKKYMANPWRLANKKRIEMKKEYRSAFYKNMLISAVLSWPLIIYLANKRQYTPTGVPITKVLPHDIFNPNVKLFEEKNKYTRRAFKWGIMKYTLLFSFTGALLFTEFDFLIDPLNARPDLGQFRAMTGYVPDKEVKVFEMFDGKSYPDQETTVLKRIKKSLLPSVDYNPSKSDYLPFFDYKRGYYPDEDVSSYYSN